MPGHPLIIEKGAMCFYSVFCVDLWGMKEDGAKEKLKNIFEKNKVLLSDKLYCPDIPEAKTICECFSAADEFHVKNEEINTFYRIYIGTGWFCTHDNKKFKLQIFVSFYPHRNLGIMHFNIPLEDVSVDEVIGLRYRCEEKNSPPLKKDLKWREQCLKDLSPGDKDLSPLTKGRLEYVCANLIKDITTCFSTNKKNSLSLLKKEYGKDWKEELNPIIDNVNICKPLLFLQSVIEIQKIKIENGIDNAKQWAIQNSLAMYGLVTGDEGYVYVPEDVASAKIQNGWSTRGFLYVFVYGYHLVVLNFKNTSLLGKKYMAFQAKINEAQDRSDRYKYFHLNTCIASIDHGVVNCIERNIIIHYEYHYVIQRDQDTDITFNQKRNKILTFIYRTAFEREAIQDLFGVISEASGTAKSIELIRKRCVLQSEEKSLHNQRRNNHLIIILSISSILLAFFSVTRESIVISNFRKSLCINTEIFIMICFVVGFILMVLSYYNSKTIRYKIKEIKKYFLQKKKKKEKKKKEKEKKGSISDIGK